jgi:hypothetical protein
MLINHQYNQPQFLKKRLRKELIFGTIELIKTFYCGKLKQVNKTIPNQ